LVDQETEKLILLWLFMSMTLLLEYLLARTQSIF